ncbi:MAG: EcsC family protein [Alphaproteobacteria bacterium]
MKNLPVVQTTDLEVELLGLAHAHDRAGGPLLRLVNKLGGGIEAQMARLPDGVRDEIERAVTAALIRAHGVAGAGRYAPDLGPNGSRFAAMATGALGGAAGLAGSLVELPLTITVMLHAIRSEALAAGYDPDDPAVRLSCVEVFAAGSPLHSDDGVNTAFLSARMAVAGGGFQRILAVIVPRLSVVLGEKLALQAVPVIGAVTGAALNAMFLNYYREMARIRFRLLRLAESHGAEAVLTGFSRAQAKPALTLK